MKYLLLFLWSIQICYADLSRIYSDQDQYSVGEMAVFLADMNHQPERSSQEFVYEFELNGSPIYSVGLSKKKAIAFSSILSLSENIMVTFSLYIRDKATAKTLESSIAQYKKDNQNLLSLIEDEPDEPKKILLQQQVDKNLERIAELQNYLDASKTLLEVRAMQLPVIPALLRNQAIYTLNADKSSYQIGERAMVTANILPQFGEPGEMENVLKADLDGVSVLSTMLGVDTFVFKTPIFTSPGSKEFSSSLFVRSKVQADLLRDALKEARLRKMEWENEKNSHEEKPYYEAKIQELQKAISFLQDRLDAILLPLGQQNLSLQVNP